MMNPDLFQRLGVLIEFEHDTDFLKIKETLTRIGVESKRNKALFQSCHILHKRGYYSILHFKESSISEKRPSNLNNSLKCRIE
jgi:hypothetical protein